MPIIVIHHPSEFQANVIALSTIISFRELRGLRVFVTKSTSSASWSRPMNGTTPWCGVSLENTGTDFFTRFLVSTLLEKKSEVFLLQSCIEYSRASNDILNMDIPRSCRENLLRAKLTRMINGAEGLIYHPDYIASAVRGILFQNANVSYVSLSNGNVQGFLNSLQLAHPLEMVILMDFFQIYDEKINRNSFMISSSLIRVSYQNALDFGVQNLPIYVQWLPHSKESLNSRSQLHIEHTVKSEKNIHCIQFVSRSFNKSKIGTIDLIQASHLAVHSNNVLHRFLFTNSIVLQNFNL